MARRKHPWNGFKTFLLILGFLLGFTVLPIATSIFVPSLAFVIRSTPLFSMTTIFALLLATLFRLQFVAEVPQKTLGVLVDHNGAFKSLLPPGQYWIKPRAERIKACLSLEPTSTQMPLLKLRASDGEVPALVVIIIWRVRADMADLLLGQHGPAVQRMAMKSHQQREQFVRGAVTLTIRQQIQQRTILQAEADLADTLGRPLQTAAVKLLSSYLLSVGLEVDQIELVGAPASAAPKAGAAPSTSAQEARKLLAEVQRKLKPVLRPPTPPITPQQVAQYAWQAHQSAAQARSDINEISDLLNRYVAAVSDAFDPLYRQARQRPDITPVTQARQDTFARLTLLQQHVGELGKQLIALDNQARCLPAPPFDLTPTECSMLFEVLDAIERKKINLDTM